MKNFMWIIFFVFIVGCCGRANAAEWTVEEQCQFYNKWSVRADTVTGALHGLDVSYLQHPPILMVDTLTGQKIVGGICPNSVPGYGYYND